MKWPVKKIQEVASIHTGKTPSTSDASNFEGDIPFATPSDLNGVIVVTNRHVSLNGSKSLTLVRAGASLVGCIGDVGKIGFATVPMTFNQQINAVVWNQKLVDDKYGFFVLRFLSNVIKQKAVSAVVPILNKTNFSKIEIPLPPLAEQQRIALLLDTADRILKQRESAIAKLDELAQSVFVDMFGDVIKNNKGWTLKKLSDVTTKLGSGATPRGGDSEYKSVGISLIRSLNVHDGEFRTKNLAHIDDEQANKLSNVVVSENDILLNITGASVARVCRAPISVLPARVNQHVMIVRPSKSLNAVYLEHLLLSAEMKNKLLSVGSSGATREAITKASAENLLIPVPPIEIQSEFCKKFKELENIKSNMLNCLDAIKQLSSSLQNQSFAVN